MYLFDIIRTMNDEIGMFLNKGLPGPIEPRITAVTDGYTVHVHFLDKLIWDSSTWIYERDQTCPSEADERYEMRRLERHMKNQVMNHLLKLFDIQW